MVTNLRDPLRLRLIRELGREVAAIKEFAYNLIQVGANPLEVSRAVERRILEVGTPIFKGYQGYPEAVCISVNEVLIHGIPSQVRPFKEGDLVKVDLGLGYNGLCGDSAFSKLLGGSEEGRRLIKAAYSALQAGVRCMRAGVSVAEVERAIGREIAASGYFTTRHYSGHGIGVKLHEEPAVFNSNFYPQQARLRLREGMLLCIEPMLLQTDQGIETLGDGWSVVAKDGRPTAH